MKKKTILCVFLCCCLLLTLLGACSGTADEPAPAPAPAPQPADPPPQQASVRDDAIYTVDFSDGKTDFLKLNTTVRGDDPDLNFEIKSADGADVLALNVPNGGNSRLGIGVKELLGDRAADVRLIVFDIYAEFPDGNFRAVSGEVAAINEESSLIQKAPWAVYVESRNPNQASFEFAADKGFTNGASDILEFTCLINGAADKGEAPAIVCIKSISFYDTSNAGIPVDTSASWAGPDSYGEINMIAGRWALPYESPQFDGTWHYLLTPGTDGITDEYMPWEIVASSYGIVYEMEDPGDGGYTFVHFGAYNGWNWTEVTDYGYYADGKLTILWDDIGLDTSAIAADPALKFTLGNWNDVPVRSVYLLYEGTEAVRWAVPYITPQFDGTWHYLFTPGTDGITDEYMPWEILASSYGIVYEMEDPEDGGYTFVHFGAYNGWSWTEVKDYGFYADGKLTILWSDIGFDTSAIEADPAVKFAFGNWNDVPVSICYLILG